MFPFRRLITAFLLLLPAALAMGQEEEGIIRLKEGELPQYTDLLLRSGTPQDIEARYLVSLPVQADDIMTSNIVFAEVPEDADYAEMNLPGLIAVGLQNNFDIIIQELGTTISASSLRSAQARFIPFLDLVANARYDKDRNENATRTVAAPIVPEGVGGLEDLEPVGPTTVDTTAETQTRTIEGGVEGGLNLPTGGAFTVNGLHGRTDTKNEDGSFIIERDQRYDSSAELRLTQPLLRGGGFDVGTADLRRARLSEMDSQLGLRIRLRDTAQSIISTYFQILQAARQLKVSADAIQERLRFLDETQVRYDLGRVAESEILRAEIQYLTELETAINRRRSLDDARENMLLLLGLPLDTPISFVDITDDLSVLGRVVLPTSMEAIAEALASRPELLRQELSIKQSQIDVQVSRNDLLPNLDFDAVYRRTDSDVDYDHSRGLENSNWGAGLSLRIPLQNIQRRESARQSSIRLEQEKTRRLQLERNLTQDVLSSLRSVLSTEAQLTLLKKNVEQARRNLELINGSFEVGFATVTEVRLAQDDLFNSETRYSSALLNYQIQLAQLYLALGRPLF